MEAQDWSALPRELILSMAERLGIADIARLRAVCSIWAWALGRPRRGWPIPPCYKVAYVPIDNSSPWMLLPNKDGCGADYCDFLRLSDRSVRRISPAPHMVGRICVGGSPDGWLVTIDLALNPRILNPLTGEEFPLPSIFTLFPHHRIRANYSADGSICSFTLKTPAVRDLSFEEFQYRFVRKIILSSAPPHCIAVVIYGIDPVASRLAVARPGDLAWSPGPHRCSKDFKFSTIEDVVYREEDHKFYAVTYVGSLIVLDLNDYSWGSLQPVKATELGSMDGRDVCSGAKHVVFSTSGDLLQVWRQIENYTERDEIRYEQGETELSDDDYDYYNMKGCIVREETFRIKIHKFDPEQYDGENPDSCWVRVKDLGDQAIFVGCNHSMSLSTADKPWLKRNCVYFTDNSNWCKAPNCKAYARDGGIYDVRNKSFERFFPRNCKVNWPPPAWFVPSILQFTSDK